MLSSQCDFMAAGGRGSGPTVVFVALTEEL